LKMNMRYLPWARHPRKCISGRSYILRGRLWELWLLTI